MKLGFRTGFGRLLSKLLCFFKEEWNSLKPRDWVGGGVALSG